MQNTKIVQKTLFEIFKVGELTLKNRILMSPLTRCRADPKTFVPTDLMATYYKQRYGFGLIIAEATGVSHNGLAFNGGPAIFNEEQANGWKNVVQQVHDNDGLIVMQLWHGGRAANQNITQQELIAPSAIPIRGENKSTGKPFLIPREMTTQDMQQVINDYKKAAEYCKQAGFDGVQVHCANGYLLDEFLRDGSNQRKDEFGGNFKNRTRFPLQVIDEVMKVYSPGRICVRISPVGRSNDMYDSDPVNLYSYFLQQLDKRKLAFVEIREFDNVNLFDQYWPQKGVEQCKDLIKALYKNFTNGALAANQSLTYDSALDKINKGECDLASFGKFSISNPDLPERLKNGWPLTPFDVNTFYTPGSQGYTDFLTYSEQQEQKKKQESGNLQI